VTFTSPAPVAGGCHLGSGCGYPAPGYPESFIFQPIFTIGSFSFTLPMLLILLAAALVIWFFWPRSPSPSWYLEGYRTLASWG